MGDVLIGIELLHFDNLYNASAHYTPIFATI